MPYVFQTRTKSGKPHARWRFQYVGWDGKKRTATGATTKSETEKLASRIQSREDEIRKGYRPAPKASDMPRDFGTIGERPEADTGIVAEYMAWGRAGGGRRGHPWGKKHAEKRAFYLEFWRNELGLNTLTDMEGCLPRVEKTLRRLQGEGKVGKTLNNYAEGLAAFCDWCVQRGYLTADPLAGLSSFDATPRTMRRVLNPEQLRALLDATDGTAYGRRRRLGYEVALCSGLRVGELKSLRVGHLDTKRGALRLEAAWTKNRRDGWQPLPGALVSRLVEAAKGNGPDAPLVFVARETSEAMKADLERAGMTRHAPGGKADFHSLRHCFVTLLHNVGASFEEARILARHAAHGLTDGIYTHVAWDRLKDLVEALWRSLKLSEESTIGAQRLVVGAESLCLARGYMVGREGFEPP